MAAADVQSRLTCTNEEMLCKMPVHEREFKRTQLQQRLTDLNMVG